MVSILSLGNTPLANSLLTEEQLDLAELTYPLDLAFCANCSLVQITETVPRDTIFSDYVYFSSFSEMMLSHAKSIVQETINARNLASHSLAMEIGSNDGYLLQYYKEAEIPVLGIEPAVNIATVAREEKGVRIGKQNTLFPMVSRCLGQRRDLDAKRLVPWAAQRPHAIGT